MIEISDLHKSLIGNKVLKGVNLKINTGSTCVIIGRSGCGKSVLLKHIVGILKGDQGKVLIDGQDVGALNEGDLDVLRL
ncbi:MAG: ATP-binding cassette domain-containing protein [Candidatus Omnitrophica bacterium]|nr:ATP-binding cassette domain-containing protein [Candidatus Omnitrophota bacterium]